MCALDGKKKMYREWRRRNKKSRVQFSLYDYRGLCKDTDRSIYELRQYRTACVHISSGICRLKHVMRKNTYVCMYVWYVATYVSKTSKKLARLLGEQGIMTPKQIKYQQIAAEVQWTLIYYIIYADTNTRAVFFLMHRGHRDEPRTTVMMR